jgi:hypothetical protein
MKECVDICWLKVSNNEQIILKGGIKMPRGKELEQLPMANIVPGAGMDHGRYNRKSLEGNVQKEQPEPADVEKENEDMI